MPSAERRDYNLQKTLVIALELLQHYRSQLGKHNPLDCFYEGLSHSI
jgi:hypothetical protein